MMVPLNTRHAQGELADCIRDSGNTVILADGSHASIAVSLAAECESLQHVLYMADGSAPPGILPLADARQKGSCDRAAGGGGLAAGIFYTGGTTGTPKGVVLSHDNILVNAWHILPALGWGDRTEFLHAAPMFHLAAILVVAGTHAIVPAFDPETVIKVPMMFGALTRGESGPCRPWLRFSTEGRPCPRN